MVRGVEGHKLIQPTLIVDSAGNRPPLTVSAQEAELHSNPQERQLIIQFHNFQVSGPIEVSNPDTYEHVISLDELTGVSSTVRSPSAIALHEIPAEVEAQRKQLDAIQQSTTATAAFAMLTGDFDSLSEQSWTVPRARTSRRPTSIATPLHRTLAPLGQWLQLPLLRIDRCADGDSTAAC